jgi:PAS domain S-box-containing protein
MQNPNYKKLKKKLKSAEDEAKRLKIAEFELQKQRKKYKALYKESQRDKALYISLLNSSADAIAVFDLEGRVNFLSPSFTKIFGWTLEECKGKRIPFLHVSESSATMSFAEELLNTGKPVHGFETKRLTKSGTLLDVSISASRFNDYRGQPAGILFVLRDITQTKQLEAQFQQAHKLEAIGTLAGGIAHDFNNILMGIQANSTLLENSLSSYSEKLKNIDAYINSGTDLTRQLLGFARGGKYEVKPTNLNEVIKRQNRMFGRTKKEITLRGKYDDKLWTTEVDVGQIEQVLLNLYVNAAQAMPKGGKLYVETKNTVLNGNFRDPSAYQPKPGKYVKISVTDTGEGMDSATAKRIFDPFFTTKSMGGGTGLGLASTYGIIKNHGGIINVKSQKGRGTTFNIYLPSTEKTVTQVQINDERIIKGSETILLVDDEDMIIDVQEILKSLGYKVILARGGREAINAYTKHGSKIDLIILDMIMPDIGGGEVYDRIKKKNPDIRVLLSSGYSIDGQAEDILARGCNGFLQKPFNIRQLSQKIRGILDSEFEKNRPNKNAG